MRGLLSVASNGDVPEKQAYEHTERPVSRHHESRASRGIRSLKRPGPLSGAQRLRFRLLDYLAGAPDEQALRPGMGVDNNCHLLGSREEVSVDEEIVLGEEDAEARMAVVPAEDFLAGVVAIKDIVDLGPCVVGERDASPGAIGLEGGDDIADQWTAVFSEVPNEDTPDLCLEAREDVVAYLLPYAWGDVWATGDG
jgi:hypothetical protein